MTKLADELALEALKDASKWLQDVWPIISAVKPEWQAVDMWTAYDEGVFVKRAEVSLKIVAAIAALRQPDAVPGDLVERLEHLHGMHSIGGTTLLEAAAAIQSLTAERDLEALVTLVASILEGWDMKEPPNEYTGHDYRDVARSIIAALRQPDADAVSRDEPRTIYIQWSGDEQFIRKWSFKPFHLSKLFNAESAPVSDMRQPRAVPGDLVERLDALIERQRNNLGVYMNLGTPDQELVEAAAEIQSITAERDATLARVVELEAGVRLIALGKTLKNHAGQCAWSPLGMFDAQKIAADLEGPKP